MGLCIAAAAMGNYTYDEVKNEVAYVMPRLPLAELQGGGIIKLPGTQSLFSTKPLLDPKWLKGRLTMAEYQAIVEAVNEGTIGAMVGMRKMFSPYEIPQRTQTAANGAQAAADALNRQWNSRGVYVTFTLGEMHSNVVGIHHGHATTQHKQDAYLYIRID